MRILVCALALCLASCSTGPQERADQVDGADNAAGEMAEAESRGEGREAGSSDDAEPTAKGEPSNEDGQPAESGVEARVTTEQAAATKDAVEVQASALECLDAPEPEREQFVILGPATPFYASPGDSKPAFVDDSAKGRYLVVNHSDYSEWRLIGEEDGWLQVESLGVHGYRSRCHSAKRGLLMLRVRAWVRASRAETVVQARTKLDVEGGQLVLAPGQVVGRAKGTTYLPSPLGILKTAAEVPADQLGTSYTRVSDDARPVFRVSGGGLRKLAPGTYPREKVTLGQAPIRPYTSLTADVRGEGERVNVTVAMSCMEATFEAPKDVFSKSAFGIIGAMRGPAAGDGARTELEPGQSLHWGDGTEAGLVGCETSFYGEPRQVGELSCYDWHYPRGAAKDDPESSFELCIKPSR